MTRHRSNERWRKLVIGLRQRYGRVNLAYADLTGAKLYGADLAGAYLYGADLTGAKLYGADLTRAKLYGAYLHGADLMRAKLYGADLTRAKLYGAYLSGAYLSGANLSGAKLYGADLTRADLTGADLTGADLYGADLYGADLYGADLMRAKLTAVKFTHNEDDNMRYVVFVYGTGINGHCELYTVDDDTAAINQAAAIFTFEWCEWYEEFASNVQRGLCTGHVEYKLSHGDLTRTDTFVWRHYMDGAA